MEHNADTVAYQFTPAEFERLAAFRQAVLAGFYTDELQDEEAHWSFDIPALNKLVAAILESDS
jgi:hypothetical protein